MLHVYMFIMHTLGDPAMLTAENHHWLPAQIAGRRPAPRAGHSMGVLKVRDGVCWCIDETGA